MSHSICNCWWFNSVRVMEIYISKKSITPGWPPIGICEQTTRAQDTRIVHLRERILSYSNLWWSSGSLICNWLNSLLSLIRNPWLISMIRDSTLCGNNESTSLYQASWPTLPHSLQERDREYSSRCPISAYPWCWSLLCYFSGHAAVVYWGGPGL
jgi:hypothetical protein